MTDTEARVKAVPQMAKSGDYETYDGYKHAEILYSHNLPVIRVLVKTE